MHHKISSASILSALMLSACGGNKSVEDPGPDGSANLIINEIVASSGNDDFLAGNDWIEIYNAGSGSADLSAYTLEDSGSGPINLPGITLAAGQYLVIAAVDSDDTNPPSPSVPFKLGKEDSVTLSSSGTVLSSLSWVDGDAPEDASYGPLNHSDLSAQTLEPTPGAANIAFVIDPTLDWPRGNPSGNSSLKISEVVPSSDRPSFYEGSDWVELINTGNTAINLGEYALADSESGVEPLPAITLQPGQSEVVVAGDNPPNDGAPYVTFGLGREDSVSIFRGSEEVDYVSWGRDESKNGRSFGRLNNDLQVLYPTPEYANVPYVLFTENEVFTVRVDIPQQDWQAILADPQAEQYYPANFELNGAKIENVGFRVKGQGSLMFVQNSVRYGFKVDMNRYEDQKFMGMKKLVFNQSFSDPSFMRDKLSYDLMREAGVPSPQITYVDMWVAGQHLGLYQMVEMIDTEFLEKHFADDEDDLGDLHKGELAQRLTWTNADYSSYASGLPLKTNDETIGTPEEGAALVNFLDQINNGSNPLNYIRSDIMVNYLAALVLTGNMDSPIGATANNFYLYENRAQGKFTILPWDFNLGFGMWGDGPATTIGAGFGDFDFGDFDFGDFDFGDFDFGNPGPAPAPVGGCRIVEHVIDNPVHDTDSGRPMLDPILQNSQLKAAYHAELQRLLDTVYNDNYMRNKINTIANLIDPYVQADPTKFFTYDEWRMSLEQGLPEGSDISGGRGANAYGPAPGLLTFIQEKATNIRQQLNGNISSSNNGGTACPN